MELESKPGSEHARQRRARFWRGDSRRPVLWAVRPKAGIAHVARPGCYQCAFGDIEPVIERAIG